MRGVMAFAQIRDGFVDSQAVTSLGDWSFRVYTNLLIRADYAGRFSACREILRSQLFPRGINRRAEDFDLAVGELVKAGLVIRYEYLGKPFLQLTKVMKVGSTTRSLYPWRDGLFKVEYIPRDTPDGIKEFVATSLPEWTPLVPPADGVGEGSANKNKNKNKNNNRARAHSAGPLKKKQEAVNA
jgi:hypothetical protein